MKENTSYFDTLSGKRYYHVVAIESRLYSLQNYWKDIKVLKRNIESCQVNNFIIEYGKLITETRYHNGEEDFSVNKDKNAPPYQYDLFALEIKKQNILILGFPFKSLARATLQNLLSQNTSIKNNNFLKPDLDKLIKLGNKKSEFKNDLFTTHFSGIELILTEETNISSVNLDGDKPLDSNLYKSVFLKKVEKDQCLLEKCSLKCETIQSENVDLYKTKSIIHLDSFGNFKLYLHGRGKNIVTVPFLLDLLGTIKCLKTTSLNPIQRLTNDEE